MQKEDAKGSLSLSYDEIYHQKGICEHRRTNCKRIALCNKTNTFYNMKNTLRDKDGDDDDDRYFAYGECQKYFSPKERTLKVAPLNVVAGGLMIKGLDIRKRYYDDASVVKKNDPEDPKNKEEIYDVLDAYTTIWQKPLLKGTKINFLCFANRRQPRNQCL